MIVGAGAVAMVLVVLSMVVVGRAIRPRCRSIPNEADTGVGGRRRASRRSEKTATGTFQPVKVSLSACHEQQETFDLKVDRGFAGGC